LVKISPPADERGERKVLKQTPCRKQFKQGQVRQQIGIRETLADNSDVRNDFQKAKGAVEFYADGVFVHIRNDEDKAEYREMKVAALAKRLFGERATPSNRNLRWCRRLRR
jgi:hypothetical protein